MMSQEFNDLVTNALVDVAVSRAERVGSSEASRRRVRMRHEPLLLLTLTVLALIFALTTMASASLAATFTVTGFGDPAGATCVGTTCSSLRVAVYFAEQPQYVGSTIALKAGTYTLGENTTLVGPLFIKSDMNIDGAGESATTIKQDGPGDGVVQIPVSTANVTISDLTVTGGHPVGASPATATGNNAGAPGAPATGGIQVNGALTLNRVDVTGNLATGGDGAASTGTGAPGVGGNAVGGIEVVGSLTLNSSEVTGNTAVGGKGGAALGGTNGASGGSTGGGVFVDPGAGNVKIGDSSISKNVSRGGIGGASAGTSANHDGAGGNVVGGLASLPVPGSNASAVSVSGSTLDGNYSVAGAGGGGNRPATGGTGGKAEGGGIYATNGPLVVSDSVIDGNKVIGGVGGWAPLGSGAGGGAVGGGLAALYANLNLARTTVASNSALAGRGGPTYATSVQPAAGADAFGGGTFLTGTDYLVNTTVADNLANGSAGGAASASIPAGIPGRGWGGGVYAQESTTRAVLASDTVSGNAVQSDGGAAYGGNLESATASVTLSDTIFSAGIGSATTANCGITRTPITDAGFNLESTSPSECGLSQATDVVGADPRLAVLAYHGGLAPTMALTGTSPAEGAGGPCRDPSQIGDPPLAVDGRGAPRTVLCDIGAYQIQPPPGASHSRRRFAGAKMARRLVVETGRRVKVSLYCPAATSIGRCAITVRIYTVNGALSVRPSGPALERLSAARLLGRGRTDIRAGHHAAAVLTLTEAGRRVVRHVPTKVRVVLVSTDARRRGVRRTLRGTIYKPTRS